MGSSEILACVLSSTLAATVIASIKELILWRLNRKAKKADEKELKEDKLTDQQDDIKEIKNTIKELKDDIKNMQDQISATVKHDKIILRDKIKYLISKYIEYGEITLDEKQAIQHMWHIYHYELGGNGDLDDWMDMLDEIQVKNGISVVHYSHHTTIKE